MCPISPRLVVDKSGEWAEGGGGGGRRPYFTIYCLLAPALITCALLCLGSDKTQERQISTEEHVTLVTPGSRCHNCSHFN